MKPNDPRLPDPLLDRYFKTVDAERATPSPAPDIDAVKARLEVVRAEVVKITKERGTTIHLMLLIDHDIPALLAHVERVRGLLHEAMGCAVALNLGGLVTRIEQALAQPPRDEKEPK